MVIIVILPKTFKQFQEVLTNVSFWHFNLLYSKTKFVKYALRRHTKWTFAYDLLYYKENLTKK